MESCWCTGSWFGNLDHAHTTAAGKVGDASAFPHPAEEEGGSSETELKKENKSKQSRKVTYTRGG